MNRRLKGLLLVSAVLPGVSGAAVVPYVDCVTVDAASQKLTAYFGYLNAGAEEVIPIGANNSFSSPAVGQPETFAQDFHISRVASVVDAAGSVTWSITASDGSTYSATADIHAPSCPTWCEQTPGACGVAGPIGATGPAGPQGGAGSAGPQGSTGAQGTAGLPATAGCRRVESAGSEAAVEVGCAAGERVVTGGGSCRNRLGTLAVQPGAGAMEASFPASDSAWRVTCAVGQATAEAICCKVAP